MKTWTHVFGAVLLYEWAKGRHYRTFALRRKDSWISVKRLLRPTETPLFALWKGGSAVVVSGGSAVVVVPQR